MNEYSRHRFHLSVTSCGLARKSWLFLNLALCGEDSWHEQHVPSRTGHEGPKGEWRYSSSPSLTSALDGVGGQRHAQAAYPRQRDPLRTIQEPAWAPGPVWTGARLLAHHGIRSQDRPGSNESLHRLQYAGRLTQQGMRESLRCTGNFTGLLTDRFLSFSPPLQANSVIEPQIRHRPPPHTSFPNHRSLVSSCMYLFGDTGGDINP